MRIQIRLALVFASFIFTTGCKLVIITSPGGSVVSLSGENDCVSGKVCDVNIDSDNFDDIFTAIPAVGYEFESWQSGAGFQCSGSTNASCEVSNIGASAIGQLVLNFISSDDLLYLMPRFTFVGIDTDGDGVNDPIDTDDDNDGILDALDPCPLDPDSTCGGNVIFADGKTWYQPDLFLALQTSEISGICPEGICHGRLNSIKMDGWIWATKLEVRSLFESYGLSSIPTPDGCVAAASFFSDGWRKTNTPTGIGITLDLAGSTRDGVSSVSDGSVSCVYWDGIQGFPSTIVGGWFYHDP